MPVRQPAPQFELIEAGNGKAASDAIRQSWRQGEDSDKRLRMLETLGSRLKLHERGVDPPSPEEGNAVIWQSDGTGTGDDGDILVQVNVGGVVKTCTLCDYSTVGGETHSVVTKTTTYVATAADRVILCDASGGAFTVTLPAASAETSVFTIIKIDSSANAVTIAADGSDTILGAATLVINFQYDAPEPVSDGVSAWYLT